MDTRVAGDFLHDYDFDAHNAEVRRVWDAYYARSPLRPPMVLGVNPRYLLCEPTANETGLDFRTYSEDADAMFEAQLGFQRWVRHNLLQDAELGPPSAWSVYVDFQNYYEAAWFGAPVEYRDGQVPYAAPVYAEQPERLLDAGMPGPFDGIMGKADAYYARFSERAQSETYLDLPIAANRPGTGMGTDGPVTVACCLFGAEFVCETMAADPRRMERLLTFITDATVSRMAAWRERAGVALPQDGFGIADDSIALLSPRMYREHVLPLHRRIYDTFGTQKGRSIHLCGDAARLFRIIHDELNVEAFDTGFPIDFGAVRAELGPNVQIHGGPHAGFLVGATTDEVRDETRRILRSGVTEGGRLVLREGNNLAPGTPVENIAAMYACVREYSY